jgi:ABC-type lipoprotein release transport system permease subunit
MDGYRRHRRRSSVLRGVGANDVVIFAAVAMVIAGSTLIASWIPARRPSQIEAVTALGEE